MYRNVHFGGNANLHRARPPPLLPALKSYPFDSLVAVSRIISLLCIFVGSGDKTLSHTHSRVSFAARRHRNTSDPIELGRCLCLWVIRSHTSSIHVHTIVWKQFLPFDDSEGTKNNNTNCSTFISWCSTHMRTYADEYMVVYSLDNTLINATHSLSHSVCSVHGCRPSRFVAIRTTFAPFRVAHTSDMLAVSMPAHIRSFTQTKLLSDVNLGHERSLAHTQLYLEYGGVSVSA